LHLLQKNNVVLSDNSWEDIARKYRLHREMEVVIRYRDDSSSLFSRTSDNPMPKRTVWAYRALLVASAFSLVGNIPVQSRLLSSHNNKNKTFEIAPEKESVVSPISTASTALAITNPATTNNKEINNNINTKNAKKKLPDEEHITLADKTISTDDPDIVFTDQENNTLELTLPKRAIETYAGHVLETTNSKWTTYHVKSYDNLTNIFHKLGHQEALAELKQDKTIYKELKALNRGGAIVRASSDNNGKLSELVFTHDNKNSYVLSLKDGSYSGSWKKGIFETRQARASFTIKNGLFFDGRKAGIQNKIIRQIIKVFDWDIDFSHDIRVGDKVTAVFEEIYHDGDKVGSKNLLAAEFINKKRVLRTVRYTFKDGRSDYFTPDGREMKKAFIRTPIAHARVSSHFNPGRYHPVLHRMRAHKGTDFAARRGTSIMTTGNGTVKFIGRKGGYGRMVIISHREGYETRYAHMSRFKKGLKKGDKVYQGDIIGYVGSSGLATGPHCHYELRKKGIAMDPMRIKLPNSMSLAKHELQDFRNKAINLVLQLNVLHRFVEADIEIDSSIGG